ncbi:hypothetical protein [Tautonia marina]|uniref:hypothetical protein n=1 Tax=Tautonia marina TaxID=2653855 RepID=UPI001260B64E|nr:hypothetical protein [Tautonia marina]
MSDHRKVLSATGLAFIALGLVAFSLGMVSSWMNVQLPIPAYGMLGGAGLILSGIGLMIVNRGDSGRAK